MKRIREVNERTRRREERTERPSKHKQRYIEEEEEQEEEEELRRAEKASQGAEIGTEGIEGEFYAGEDLGEKEIYTYEAPWLIYAMGWSSFPEKDFRLAIGSFLEDQSNKGWQNPSNLSVHTEPFPPFPFLSLPIDPLKWKLWN